MVHPRQVVRKPLVLSTPGGKIVLRRELNEVKRPDVEGVPENGVAACTIIRGFEARKGTDACTG